MLDKKELNDDELLNVTGVKTDKIDDGTPLSEEEKQVDGSGQSPIM